MLTLALATGCGGGGSDDGTKDPDQTSRPSAAAALRSAVRAVANAGTARFTAHVDLGTYAIDQAGLFSLDPAGQIVTYVVTVNSISRKGYYIGVDGHAYVSLPDKDKNPTKCFLTGSPAKMSALTGIDTVGYGTDIPVMAYVLASARGEEYQGFDEVRGTLDLADVVSLMSSKLTSQLQLKRDEHTVPATFELHNDRLSGFNVTAFDLIRAAREAGIDDAGKVFSSNVVVQGDIDQIGEPVDIAAPDKKDLVPVGQSAAELRAAARRCQKD